VLGSRDSEGCEKFAIGSVKGSQGKKRQKYTKVVRELNGKRSRLKKG
jgi:hypothetical protein